MVGNTVSHSKRRVKRKFNVNLFKKKFYYPEENRWITLTVSASGIRTINKKGVNAAIQEAKEKGIIEKI
jgi:large subunit ribosomal protein L28